jgi:predicted permease
MRGGYWLRLRSLFRGRAVDRELDEELRFHVEQYVSAAMSRGMPRAEAVRLALIELGGFDQIKEEHRDARGVALLADLARDIRYALRTFRRLPGFAAVALLVLALGIAATTVMFTVIDGVLLRPLRYPDPDKLVTLHGRSETLGESWGFSYPDFLDAQRESRSLTLAAWAYGGGTIGAPGEPAYVDGQQVSADLFAVLKVPLAHGRAFQPDEDRPGGLPVAILSHALWQRRYGGTTAALGQQLVFEGKPYTVVGVAPVDFRLGGGADVFTPLGQNTEVRMRNRQARFIHVLGRLGSSVTLADSRAELGLIARHLATEFPESNAGRDLLVQPLLRDVVGDVGSTLWLLLAAVALVLVIACVNVASLLLARASQREGELATRVALGASRGRVIRQCLAESAVLGLAGGMIGVPLARAAIAPFVAFWPGSLPRAAEIQLDWRLLLAALAASLASGLAFGLVPALRVPTVGLEDALRTGGRTIVRSSRRLHSAFVVTQLALAVVLLVIAGTLGRTLITMSSLDPGLNVRNVVTARVALSPSVLANPGQIQAAWTDVLDRVRRVPGVETAALTDIVPMRAGENSLPYSPTAPVPPAGKAPVALVSTVTPDYLKVMGIPLRAGRFFDEHDRVDSETVLVIDEQLALHAFGRTDVVGRQLWVPAIASSPITIIGVVGHVRHWGLARDDGSPVRDQIYYAFAQVPPRLLRLFSSLMSMAIRTRTAPLDVIEPLRTALRGASGGQAIYEVRTMEQLVSASLARQRFLVLLFAIFGGLAMLLASVGIYGVLAYLTAQRAPEFGVRVALGSTAAGVIRLVLRQSAALIAAGVATGAGAAWAGGRLLERFVEGTRPTAPATFVIMTGVLAVAALSASVLPARRASQVDAMRALKNN